MDSGLISELRIVDGTSLLNVVGVSFHRAPVEFREVVAVTPEALDPLLRSLGRAVVLATCNRTEIYTDDLSSRGQLAAIEALAERAGDRASTLADCVYEYRGDAAVRHLFAVAAGLDSMILGETQILGQIRGAIDSAQAAGALSPILRHVFQQALRTGRRARAETFIGRHAASVSYAAVELARGVFGDLQRRRAVVIGAGETGEITARTLVEHGVEVVAVANRTIAHAQALVDRFGGEAIGLDRLAPALGRADIVISATDARDYVVPHAAVAAAMPERGERPLFLVDIAVPRDIDPAVRAIPNVILHDIDDLKAICDANLARRAGEIQRVQTLIDREVERFTRWCQGRRALPTVIALRQHVEQIREQELQEALGRLRHLGQRDHAVVADLSRAIVNKLLHQPTIRLKSSHGSRTDDLATEVIDLFGLRQPDSEAGG